MDKDERAFIESVCDTPEFRHDLHRREKRIDQTRSRLEKLCKSCDDMCAKGSAFEDATSLFLLNMKHLASADMDDGFVATILKLHTALSEIQRFRKLLLEQTQQCVSKSFRLFMATELQAIKEQGKIVASHGDKLDHIRHKYAACSVSKPADCTDTLNLLTSNRDAYNHIVVDYVRDLRVFDYTYDLEVLERFLLYVSSLTTTHKQSMDVIEDLQPTISAISQQIGTTRREVETTTKRMDERHAVVDTWLKADAKEKFIHEGYLYKRGQNKFKTWQRRFFSLQSNGQLVYTSRDKKEGWKPFVDDLRLCTVKAIPSEPLERQFCFELVTPARSFLLQAGSEQEKMRWISAIQAGIGDALGQMHRTSTVATLDIDSPQARLLKAREKQRRQLQLDVFERNGNSACADCGASDPEWMSINLGITLCIECSGTHRSLGTHLSKVRSLTLDKLDAMTSQMMLYLGNFAANSVLEGKSADVSNYKPKPDSAKAEREAFIRLKYEEKKFVDFAKCTHGTDPDVLGMALMAASEDGQLLPVQRLLLYGADANFTREVDKCTPLAAACKHGHSVLAHFLVLNNAAKNAPDVDGNTPLHHAALKADFPTVCVLVKAGVDLKRANNDGKTATELARDTCHGNSSSSRRPKAEEWGSGRKSSQESCVAIINLLQLSVMDSGENEGELLDLLEEGLQLARKATAPPPTPHKGHKPHSTGDDNAGKGQQPAAAKVKRRDVRGRAGHISRSAAVRRQQLATITPERPSNDTKGSNNAYDAIDDDDDDDMLSTTGHTGVSPVPVAPSVAVASRHSPPTSPSKAAELLARSEEEDAADPLALSEDSMLQHRLEQAPVDPHISLQTSSVDADDNSSSVA